MSCWHRRSLKAVSSEVGTGGSREENATNKNESPGFDFFKVGALGLPRASGRG
jgi:hypothetical protein